MPRFKLVLEYDGAGFHGWQLQSGMRSVQGVVESALEEVLRLPVRVFAAGRTDAGVHAAGQAAHLDAPERMRPEALRRALNAVLPRDVAVLAFEPAAPDFDARRDAVAKRYVYRILNRVQPSPLRRARTWHLRRALDVDAMGLAAAPLLGTHDFAAFQGAPGGGKEGSDTRRSLTRLEATRSGDEVFVVAEGRSFLRHMVRNLVGTLVEVGRSRRAAEDVPEVLRSGDRSRAGPTAPAHGLCLEWVAYPPPGSS